MSILEDQLLPELIPSLVDHEFPLSDNELTPNPDVARTDYMIPRLDDDPDVPLRVYHKIGRHDKPVPVLLYIHWGGFTGGSHLDYAEFFEQIVLTAGAVVVSVGYRLAPDHPYPAALHDCYAALKWIALSHDELNIDLNRIAVGGISAGGGLAAAVALYARDQGEIALCHQILIIPNLDDRFITPSSRAITDPRVFNLEKNTSAWKSYLGEAFGRDDVSLYAAPARATDLSGLPPAYLYVEEHDPLRDEGIDYANRLMQAGVRTELHVFPGTYHSAFVAAPSTASSKRAVAEHLAVIAQALRPM